MRLKKNPAVYKSCFFKCWEKILEELLSCFESNLRFWCSPWPGVENSASGRPRRSSRMPCSSDCRAISLYRRTRIPRVCYNSLRSQETPGSCPGRRFSCRKSASANRSGWRSCPRIRAWRITRMLCNSEYRYHEESQIRRNTRKIPTEGENLWRSLFVNLIRYGREHHIFIYIALWLQDCKFCHLMMICFLLFDLSIYLECLFQKN